MSTVALYHKSFNVFGVKHAIIMLFVVLTHSQSRVIRNHIHWKDTSHYHVSQELAIQRAHCGALSKQRGVHTSGQ